MKVVLNNPNGVVSGAGDTDAEWSSPAYQAFRILQVGFVAAPIRGLSGVGNRTGVRESAPGRAATE